MFRVRDDKLAKWVEYAYQMARRYRSTVNVYETWNEPFLKNFFIEKRLPDGDHEQASPEVLFKQAKAVSDRFKREGLGVQLAWNVDQHYASPAPEFGEQGARLGMFDIHDVLTYHSYERSLGGYPGDAYESIVTTERGFAQQHGRPDIPLWNSEGGPGGGASA